MWYGLKMTMGETTEMNGAGFVIFKKASMNATPLMLALVRHDGVYDFPKGHADPNETSLQTAKRECFEECSIMVSDDEIIQALTHFDGRLNLFCAVSSKAPIVTKNPTSGMMEHAGYKWVDLDEFCSNCLPYLEKGARSFYSSILTAYNP